MGDVTRKAYRPFPIPLRQVDGVVVAPARRIGHSRVRSCSDIDPSCLCATGSTLLHSRSESKETEETGFVALLERRRGDRR
jgi:hypothetical protein